MNEQEDIRFNEAAGFTQRKPRAARLHHRPSPAASMRPPVLPSGNPAVDDLEAGVPGDASMRPPVLPSGNMPTPVVLVPSQTGLQ